MIDDNVIMEPVESSNLAAVGYDEENSNLFVLFQDKNGGPGQKYYYTGVPKSVYSELMAAPSKGRFLAAHIKGHYSYGRI
jgi:hypothetical protein